jgi:hypothetical protein
MPRVAALLELYELSGDELQLFVCVLDLIRLTATKTRSGRL